MPPPKFPQLYDLMDAVWLQMYKEGHPDFLNKISQQIILQENIYDPADQRAVRMFVRNRHYRVLMPMLRGEKPKNGYKRLNPGKPENTSYKGTGAGAKGQSQQYMGQPVFPTSMAAASDSSHPHAVGKPAGSSAGATPQVYYYNTPSDIFQKVKPEPGEANSSRPCVSEPMPNGGRNNRGDQNESLPQQLIPENQPATSVSSPDAYTPLASPTIQIPATNKLMFPYYTAAMPMMGTWPFKFSTSQLTDNAIASSSTSCNGNNNNNDDEAEDCDREANANGPDEAVDFSVRAKRPRYAEVHQRQGRATVQSPQSQTIWQITADNYSLNIKPKLMCHCNVETSDKSSQTDNTENTAELESEASTNTCSRNLALQNFERELVNWCNFQKSCQGSVSAVDIQKYGDFLTSRYTIDLVLNQVWVLKFCLRYKLDVET